MTYLANLTAPCRVPITLVRVTLDFCSRSFGVAPCTGVGEPAQGDIRDALQGRRGL